MEEAVVGAIVGVPIQVVIEMLFSLSREKINLGRDFTADLEKLKDNFNMTQSILYHADMQQVTDMAVKLWLKKLEDLAFEADNALDEFNYHLLREEHNNMEAQTTMMTRIKSIFSGSYSRDPRRKLGLKIRDINDKLKLINDEASSFGLQTRLAGAHAPAVGSNTSFVGLETASFTVDPIFVGRDDDVSKIVETLTSSPTERVSILPIVGMGGLGKTTLTRKVFNDEKIKAHFGTHIWVYVSTDFDPVSLLRKILTASTSGNDQVTSKQDILKKLKDALKDKTYLLVLDDVWNRNPQKWDDFINSLSGISSSKGNGVIVTTRNMEVASIVERLCIYELKVLPGDSCWSIIKARTYGEGEIPLEFETIGRKIAERCQGLPLAANVVGAVLRGKPKEEWLSIEKNGLSNVEGDENNIQKILKLSFDNLPSPSLKKCFAYCSVFRKGYTIDRQQLIELWMAEGFLQPNGNNDMETVGNKFFDLLLQNSLLQVVWRDDGNNVVIGLHDLVHDLAYSILGPPKVGDNNVSNGTYQVRYIGRNYYGDESSPISKEEAKYLRTLFFKGEISNIIFSYYKCLHVLILMGDHVEDLPISIRELIHLRYLKMSYTSIGNLPDSIGELYHLQTLDVLFAYELKKLPSTLKYLNALRHLHISSRIELSPEIGRLTSLQTLPCFKVGHQKGHRIAELGCLKNLKGQLDIFDLEKVDDEEEAKSANLFQKPNLEKLGLHWNESRERENNDENVLEGLLLPPNLKSLKIMGFRGKKFPLWKADDWVDYNNLMEITLDSCAECEEIPMLGHLSHLKSLCLSKLWNVRSIGSSFYGIDKRSSNNKAMIVFPSLKTLRLYDMPQLTEWAEVEISSAVETQPREVKVFTCLEYLSISNCHNLKSTPSHFPCLRELYVNGIDSGLPLANITSLTKLSLKCVKGLVCLPDGLFHNNQNLLALVISSCRKLIELPDGLHTLNSLKNLSIDWCPNLKSIPYGCSSGRPSQGFTSLCSLSISWCENLINLPACEMLESCAPWLEELSLVGLSCQNPNFAMMIDSVQNMPRLAKLKIDISVHQFSPSPMGNLCNSLRSLQELMIRPCRDSSDCDSFEKSVGWILQECHSLRQLVLYGMEHSDSLPDQLQHRTTLSQLHLSNFGIETLPEWLGNLSSLEILELRECRNLRCMPSKEAMQRLSKLKTLDIYLCPLLSQRCIEQQNDDDSEWPNISHIPYIFINGKQSPSHPP